MAEIIERTFVGRYGGTYRGLLMYNEEIVRPLSFGSNWKKLRVILLHSVLDQNVSAVNAIFDVGLCSGSVRGIGSNNPVNYVGLGVGGGTTGRYVANRVTSTNAITGGWHSATGQRHYTAQHGATADYFLTDNVGSFYWGSAMRINGAYRRQVFSADFEILSATQVRMAVGGTSATAVQCDADWNAVTALAEYPLNSSLMQVPVYNLQDLVITNQSYDATNTTTATWLQSAGQLDTLNIAWSSPTNPYILWGVAVVRFQ